RYWPKGSTTTVAEPLATDARAKRTCPLFRSKNATPTLNVIEALEECHAQHDLPENQEERHAQHDLPENQGDTEY
ncbi:hypothetical protein NZK35_12485, partial [Stieleria sp. ICT_E10.1]|uniref:hypothetical protein n=1 Tax=Stieleria sedimenti TaxID=2976331 RepID=UPI0021800440